MSPTKGIKKDRRLYHHTGASSAATEDDGIVGVCGAPHLGHDVDSSGMLAPQK